MPFTAHTKDGKAITPREFNRHYEPPEIFCKGCAQPMHIRRSVIRRTHFAHNPGAGACPYDIGEYKNERDEHIYGKEAVAEYLREKEPSAIVEIEHVVTATAVKRIADVAVLGERGIIEVHEVQLSPITTQEITERTNDYRTAGVDTVCWWLGLEANTATNRQHAKSSGIGGDELEFGYAKTEKRFTYYVQSEDSATQDRSPGTRPDNTLHAARQSPMRFQKIVE